MQRQRDSLDELVEMIDAAAEEFGHSWSRLRPEDKRIWAEKYAQEHARPMYIEMEEPKFYES